ncbi:hypothetical protein QAD02_002564 [Eretmocerus hayati]|uniref:Uncharacterized protein n=1 Tax=Eretmocerus hayati TaxID=131215 RepID=A0ACC2NJA9_9HYME|nr:hypothetical protein QAD02_002564 [Eretmocerus hayati]
MLLENLSKDYHHLEISTIICSSNVDTSHPIDNPSSTLLGRRFTRIEVDDPNKYDAVYLGRDEVTLRIMASSIPIRTWYQSNGSRFCKYTPPQFLWAQKRNHLIEKIRIAVNFGIVISSMDMGEQEKIINMLNCILSKTEKKTYVIFTRNCGLQKLANFCEVPSHWFNLYPP